MSRIIPTLLTGIVLLSKLSIGLCQSSSEVYLFELSQENGKYKLANPVNLSNNQGYDNQPAFINDEEIVFASNYDNQTEIVKLNLVTKEKVRLSNTAGSEYSPYPTPDGKYISAVMLERDGSQTLIKYPIKGGEPKLIESQQKIGYYCWFDRKTVFTYVVGSPPSLQEWNTRNSEFKIIMMNPGRSLHRIPEKKIISFIHKESDEIWYLNSYDPATDKVEYITETIQGSEDMTWMNDGTAFMSNAKNIYTFNPTKDHTWQLIANMDEFGLSDATRLAISPNGQWISIVIEE